MLASGKVWVNVLDTECVYTIGNPGPKGLVSVYVYDGDDIVTSDVLDLEELGAWFLKRWTVVCGGMHPQDGVPGCVFSIKAGEALLSSRGGEELDCVRGLALKSVGSWLLDRRDW